MKPALLVIGPSRSGSSALAGVLVRLGATAPVGRRCRRARNQRGHYESSRLMRLNDLVLAEHGLTYWDPRPVPPGWLRDAGGRASRGRIAEAIEGEFGDAALPVIKDPRLCRLAPLYLDALAELGRTPLAIVPLRDCWGGLAGGARRDRGGDGGAVAGARVDRRRVPYARPAARLRAL